MLDRQPWWNPNRPWWNKNAGSHWNAGVHESAAFNYKVEHLLMVEVPHLFQCWRHLKAYCRLWSDELATSLYALRDGPTSGRLREVWTHLLMFPLGPHYQESRDVTLSLQMAEYAAAKSGTPRSLRDVPVTLSAESFHGHTIN